MPRLAALLLVPVLLLGCSDRYSSPDEGEDPVIASVTLSKSAALIPLGGGTTTDLVVQRGGGFKGPVELSVVNAPAGVIATFTPATLGTNEPNASLQLSATPQAPVGTHTLTVRAFAPGLEPKTTTFALTVATPGVTLAITNFPTSVAIGQSASVPITITRTGGYEDNVSLTVQGLPAGVTGTFTPNLLQPGQTTATLTLTPAIGTALGPMALTVRAQGIATAAVTNTIGINVVDSPAPIYTLTANPTAITVVRGQSGTIALALPRAGGFVAPVTLALEGAPVGVTGTFSPSSVTGGSSTLTLAATTTATLGTSVVTVRGTAPGMTDRTATINLNVAAPPGITLSVTPTLTVARGATANFNLGLTRQGGYDQSVSFSVDPLPPGVTATLPAPTTANVPIGATIQMVVAATALPGTYTLTFRASGVGGFASVATMTLIVQ